MKAELNERRREIAMRIRACVDLIGNGNEVARLTGIPRRTLEMYLTAQSEPKATTAAAIAKAVGVSAHWLLTGEGSMRTGQWQHQDQAMQTQSQVTTFTPAAEPELLALIIDAIQRTYKEAGAGLPSRDLGRLSGEMHNEILAEGIAPEDWRGAVQMAAGKLRREIAATAADASSRKREAS